MMARANPTFGLRPLLPADLPLVAEVFRASIEGLTADDYSPVQQEAWASAADDEAAFGTRLTGQLTLVATLDDAPVGFVSLAGADRVDMLYVHPAVAGRGVGRMLCDALERLAAARGAARLSADVSDTALSFFERRGYVPQRRNTLLAGGEWLATTTMDKQLRQATP